MTFSFLPEDVQITHEDIDPESVIVLERQRPLDDEHVGIIRASILQLGRQIVQSIVSERANGDRILIDGFHRREATRLEGMPMRAEIYFGLTRDQERLLELESNRRRKDLSPAEILAAWETFDLPMLKLETERKQLAGLRQGADSPVIPAGNNGESKAPVSITEAAVERTGHKPEWIEKVAQVRDLAANEDAPAELRQAAKIGFEKLQDSKAKVEPIFKQVLKVQESVRERSEDAEVVKLRGAERRLDDVVRDTTLMQERLEGDLREVLVLAASQSAMSREFLRGARVALTHAMTALVVAECEVDGEVDESLRRIGVEVTTLFHGQATRMLGLGVDRG